MPDPTTQTSRQQERLPGLCIRPARSCDFPRMARMANEIFQHERDIDYFNKHRRVKMGYEPEASAADKLLAAEADWRLADMRQNRRRPGRHFIVATYLKQPADYLTRRHGSQAREELLGWAEWQEPGDTAAAHDDTISDSSDQSDDNNGKKKDGSGSVISDLESVLESLTLVHANQALLVLPNGLAVHLPQTLESFRRAVTDVHDIWTPWSTHVIPSCLGQNGDTRGRDLVLRSLVLSATHWDDGVGHRLLKWGMLRAAAQGWDIQTLASAAGVSTADSFREAGFTEIGRLDVFRDTQILMGWKSTGIVVQAGARKRERELETCNTPTPAARKRVARAGRRLLRIVEGGEERVGQH